MLYCFVNSTNDDGYYDYETAEGEIKQYLIHHAGESLQKFGVDVRTGFISPEHVSRTGVNPLNYVDKRLVATMIDQDIRPPNHERNWSRI